MKVASLARDIVHEVPAYRDPEALPEGFIKLDANENPYTPSPAVISAIIDDLKSVNRYPADPSKLRLGIAEYTHTAPENVIIGNGSDEVLDFLAKAFLDPGDGVVISTPTFQMYEVVARLAGAKVRAVRMLGGFSWDIEGVRAAGRGAKMVLLCSPNNPTGNVLTEREVEMVAECDALVVIDEAYVEFAERSLTGLLPSTKNLVFLRTFSKAFSLAGLRVGYALANPEVIQTLYRVKPPYNVNRVALAAANGTLLDLDHMRRIVEATKKARRDLQNRLEQVKGIKVYPSEANFILIELKRPKVLEGNLASMLWREGFAVRDCGKIEGLSEAFTRITVGTRFENERLIECLESLLGRA